MLQRPTPLPSPPLPCCDAPAPDPPLLTSAGGSPAGELGPDELALLSKYVNASYLQVGAECSLARSATPSALHPRMSQGC